MAKKLKTPTYQQKATKTYRAGLADKGLKVQPVIVPIRDAQKVIDLGKTLREAYYLELAKKQLEQPDER